MTQIRADLHLHTTASDGTLSPAEMVRQAKAVGMTVIAITDHDTARGVDEATAEGEALGIRVIPGLELTAGGEEEIHLLGYGADTKNPSLHAFLDAQLSERRDRMQTMLDRMKALGMPIAQEDASGQDGRFMGRMNLARAMVARGYVATVREAFDRFLLPGKPAYVPRKRIDVPQGVETLTALGAVVCLAHPGRLRMEEMALLARLPWWVDAGLRGIEAYHASHAEADAIRFDRMARAHGLLVTGGSDCHGRTSGGAWIGEHLRAWRTVNEDTQTLMDSIISVQ